jgi:formylglycine-generating enzyme required for sulfatase activity
VASAEPADPPLVSGGWWPRMETASNFESFELPKPAPAPAPTPKPEAEPELAPPMRRTGWAVPGVLRVGVLLGLGLGACRSSPARVDGGAQASGSGAMTAQTDTAPPTAPTPASPPAPAPSAAAVVAMLSCPEGMLPVEGRSREGVDYRFCMDRTEVTVAAYRACPRPTCSAPVTSRLCNWNVPGRENHPVNCVGAEQADRYCAWRGGRLPTEQEWQFAAQGPDGRSYPWGEALPSDQLCWSGVNRRNGTCAIGSFPTGRSPFRLDDMSGNVWEWTSTNVDNVDRDRVCRGGGHSDFAPAWVRAANRGVCLRYGNERIGFRCALRAP